MVAIISNSQYQVMPAVEKEQELQLPLERLI